MADKHPPLTCIMCPGGDRIPRRPPVDDACRAGTAGLVSDIRILAEQLAGPGDIVPDLRIVTDVRTTPVHRPAWVKLDAQYADRRKARIRPSRIGERREPIAAGLPSGSAGNQAGSAPVSGSKHPPLPINLDGVDLMLAARQGARELFARGSNGLGIDEDQVGHLPLATTLDTWVRGWAKLRRETPPNARIDTMLRWLHARVDWACDTVPEVVDFTAELRPYRSTMRGLLHLIEEPDYKIGVSCPGCHALALYRENGELWVRCGECPAILSPTEYLRRAKDNVTCLACTDRMSAFFDALQPV